MAEFVQTLRALKVWACDPSLNDLSRLTGIPTSTLADALSSGRRRLPPLATVRAVAQACRAGDADLERWEKAWRALRQTDGRPPQERLGPEGPTGMPEPSGFVPRQLPPDIHGFCGRTAALAALDSTLRHAGRTAPGAIPISVVTGTAGVGKTALAVHWAHTVAERFPDGQLYVNLRGHSMDPALTPTQALALLLQSLGVPWERVPVDAELQVGLYRSLMAGRRTLVLLDNAIDVAQVRPLLPSSPGCHVLITSRDALTGLVAREGARRSLLDVLEPQEATALLRNDIGAERSAAEEDSVTELARLCVHLPLALRIVAANLANHPGRRIAQYVSELEESGLLAGLQVTGDPETAVAAAFDLSYTALSADARHMFRVLALVPGHDITREAAAVLAGITVPEASRTLQGLTTAHLLEEHEPGRYRRHDLLSLYAHQRAQAEQSQESRDASVERLLAWYTRSATTAAEAAYPSFFRLPSENTALPNQEVLFGSAREARTWLTAELPNLVAAVSHAAAHGPYRMAWRLADALRAHFALQRRDPDWVNAARAALGAAQRDDQAVGEAAMRLTLGTALAAVEQDQAAVDQYSAAARLYAQQGDTAGHAAAENNIGHSLRRLGRLEDAARHFQTSVELVSDPVIQENLALVNRDLGRMDEALSWGRRAVASAEAEDSHDAYSGALAVLASIENRLGRPEDGQSHALAALHVARSNGDRVGEADALARVAEAHIALNQSAEALRHARQAWDLLQDGSIRGSDEQTPLAIVQAYVGAAAPDEAIALAEHVLTEYRHSGHRLAAARTQVLLGKALAAQSASAAATQWEQALEVMIEAGAADANEVQALLHAG